MTYKILEENPAFGAGKEYGKYMAKQLMPHTVKKREIYLSENRVFINDGYVVFNIIELDEYAGKITVNINNQGKEYKHYELVLIILTFLLNNHSISPLGSP